MKSIIFSRIIFFISLYLFTINIARAESNDDLTVNKINIIGNVSFSDKELKEYLRLKEDNLYRDYIYWIDLERLEEFYHKRGYLQIIIEKPKTPNIEQEDNKINCFFNIIEEGNCTLLDSVIIINNQHLSDDEINKILEEYNLTTGNPLNQISINQAAYKIVNHYAELGYLYASIEHNYKIINQEHSILSFQIKEGIHTQIGKIIILGNNTIRTRIIERQLTIKTGDDFNPNRIYENQQRVYSTGLFSDVHWEFEGIEEKREIIDLTLKVIERKLRWIGFSLGYQSPDLLKASIEWGHENLLNNEQKLMLKIGIGASPNLTSTNYEIRYIEPWFLSTHTSFEIRSEFKKTHHFLEYTQEQLSLTNRWGRKLKEYYNISGQIKYAITNNFRIEDPSLIENKQIEEGKKTTDSILLSFSQDTRNHPFTPSKGIRYTISGEYAGGILGGSNNFTRTIIELSSFFPLRYNSIFASRQKIGKVNRYGASETVPIEERFYCGGVNTVRGYYEKEMQSDNYPEAKGGNLIILTNFELRFPIRNPFLGVLFIDGGNLWVDYYESGKLITNIIELNWSYGLGIRYNTIVGPIRVDWAMRTDIPLSWKNAVWQVSLGEAF